MPHRYIPLCNKCERTASWTDIRWRYYCTTHKHDFCKELTSHTITLRNNAMRVLQSTGKGHLDRLVEMVNLNNLVFVDVEATGRSPYSGVMTEFGAVHFTSKETFHGVLIESEPSKENPAIPSIIEGGKQFDAAEVMANFANWLANITPNRPVFVSDNPAYDFQWINYYFDVHLNSNPFGHSGRRIADFWSGYKRDIKDTQSWKRLRKTKHDHNPVNDAMGNVEAFEEIMKMIQIDN